ncbi:hypothetical protein ACLOJK_036333, partial [Asimina triloba]
MRPVAGWVPSRCPAAATVVPPAAVTMGGRYTYQPRPLEAVHDDIPMAADDASTSQPPPPPTHSAGSSQVDAPLSTALLEQILAKIDSLTYEVREVKDYQRSMAMKLASIEVQLQALNDTMNADSDGDGDGGD